MIANFLGHTWRACFRDRQTDILRLKEETIFYLCEGIFILIIKFSLLKYAFINIMVEELDKR
jgi:hypothetical protein